MADWAGDDIASLLVVRSDSLGDVLLTGPAIRALARRTRVVLAVSGAGEAAAALLPGVSELIRFDCPWILPDPTAVDPSALSEFADEVRSRSIRHAVIFTSDHQSPLPTALLLRLAGVEQIAAYSDQHSGSLLDVRVRQDPELHEAERNLHLGSLLGFTTESDRRLAICRKPLPYRIAGLLPPRYVVVHPGSSAPARTMTPERWLAAARALTAAGHELVVTGSATDDGARLVTGTSAAAVDLVGRTTFAELGSVIAHADAVCVGDTGAMHLAAAVGTPTVAVFPPTVPVHRWRPWLVPNEVLGMHDIGCANCRQRVCPLEHHPCAAIEPSSIVAAIERLIGPSRREASPLGSSPQLGELTA